MSMQISKEALLPQITYKTSRSGGKGGQNVNKVSTKVEIAFNFKASSLFTDEQKQLLLVKLSNRLNADGNLQVISEEERSQLLNKERAMDKLCQLLTKALYVRKPRKATKPKKSAIEKRLKEKQQQALKKMNRRGGEDY